MCRNNLQRSGESTRTCVSRETTHRTQAKDNDKELVGINMLGFDYLSCLYKGLNYG